MPKVNKYPMGSPNMIILGFLSNWRQDLWMTLIPNFHFWCRVVIRIKSLVIIENHAEGQWIPHGVSKYDPFWISKQLMTRSMYDFDTKMSFLMQGSDLNQIFDQNMRIHSYRFTTRCVLSRSLLEGVHYLDDPGGIEFSYRAVKNFVPLPFEASGFLYPS